MKIIKKLIYCMLTLIILMRIAIPTKVNAKVTNYLATGDSIASGYTLKDIENDSYAQLVRGDLGVSKANFQNLAIPGLTCERYYKTITDTTNWAEYTEAIKNADLITVSIGSNELNHEVHAVVKEALQPETGVDPDDPDFLPKTRAAINKASALKKAAIGLAVYKSFTSKKTKARFNEKVEVYKEYWDKSVKRIKSINKDITIIATEFYNPAYGSKILNYDIGGLIDDWVVKMNNYLHERSNNETEYKIAKIYDAFNTTKPRLTNFNVSLTSFEIDPHPTKAGHAMIAAKIMDAYATAGESNVKTDISQLKISDIKDQEYTGSAIKPSVVIKDGTKKLVKNQDFSLAYADNVDIGEAKVTIVGIGEYKGKVIKSFNIKAKEVEVKSISSLTYSNVANQEYTGSKIKPDIKIMDGNYELVNGKDYELTYKNNLNVGTAKIIIKGIGNYKDSTTKTFKIIAKDISETTVKNIANQKHTGREIKPSVLVSDGTIQLTEGEDYTLTYNNNIEVGTATVTITGINNYNKTTTKNFKIVQDELPSLKKISEVICSKIQDKIYTGMRIIPDIILTDNGEVLEIFKDYFITYKNNTNAGIGKAIITGDGDYTDSVEIEFNIAPKKIIDTFIPDIPAQLFTGEEIRPDVIVENDDTQLEEGTDYTVEYTNNTSVGSAQITLTGINNFVGTVTKTFNIVGEYNINYVLDEGQEHPQNAANASSNPTKFKSDDTFILSPPTTSENYTFLGWYEDSQFTNVITELSDVTGDTTLYAKWRNNGGIPETAKYTIQHYKETTDGDYKLEDTEEATGIIGTEIIATSKTYTGFKENDKHTDRKERGTITDDGKLVLKLYYDKLEYNIKYETDGGTPTPYSQIVRYQNKVKEPEQNPTKDGYEFKYWYYINENGKEIKFSFDEPVTQDLSLIAKWEKIKNPTTNKTTPTEKDNTVAKTILPQTGVVGGKILLIAIALAAIFGIRYYIIKKNFK